MRSSHAYAPRAFSRRPAPASSLPLVVLTVLSLLGMVGGGVWLWAKGMLAQAPQLDKQTSCLRETATTQTTFILIDVTDPFSPSEIDRVKKRAHDVAANLPRYARLVVAVLNPDDATAPRIIFLRCAPQSPFRDSSIWVGEQVLRAEWKKFEQPLLSAIDEATSSTARAERSPIIATITALTQRTDFDRSVKERELVVVSDLLEFNPKGGYSQMQGGDLVGMFRRSPLAEVWPDLTGVPVTIEYVQRPEQLFARAQTPAQRDFWTWWFKTGGASRIEFFGVREPPPLLPLPSKTNARPTRPFFAPRGYSANPYNCGD